LINPASARGVFIPWQAGNEERMIMAMFVLMRKLLDLLRPPHPRREKRVLTRWISV